MPRSLPVVAIAVAPKNPVLLAGRERVELRAALGVEPVRKLLNVAADWAGGRWHGVKSEGEFRRCVRESLCLARGGGHRLVWRILGGNGLRWFL